MNSVNSGSSAWVTFRDGFIAGHIGGAIGAGAAATGGAISAAGGGAMLAGAAGGAISGAGFSGLATDWDGQAMLQGAAYGAISGLVGGGVGGAIGGGWGALAGGAASNLTSQALYNKGDFSQVSWGSVGLSGALSFGMYHGMSYGSYMMNKGNLRYGNMTYEQYSKVNTAYQRSQFWRNEQGVILNTDGSARFVPRSDRHKFSVEFKGFDPSNGDYGTAHTHWAKPNVDWVDIGGNGSSFQKYNSNTNYPAGSYKYTTMGGSHSPADLNLPGYSLVVGRSSATYLPSGMPWPVYINPDPFIRFFLFPWLQF